MLHNFIENAVLQQWAVDLQSAFLHRAHRALPVFHAGFRLILLPSPLWGRGWLAEAFSSAEARRVRGFYPLSTLARDTTLEAVKHFRFGPQAGEGVLPLVNSNLGHHTSDAARGFRLGSRRVLNHCDCGGALHVPADPPPIQNRKSKIAVPPRGRTFVRQKDRRTFSHRDPKKLAAQTRFWFTMLVSIS